VEVFNTETLSNEGSISVGYGPNQLLLHNNELWVCNQGGFGLDSTVSIINAVSNTVEEVITLAHRPEDLVVDAFGDIWILCAGETFYDESWNVSGHSLAKLFRIDGASHAIEASFTIGSLGDHPRQLEVSPNGQTLYYENNGVFAVDVNGAELPGSLLIASAKSALSVHPWTGDVWCASISDYTNPSTVYVYAADGALLRTYEGGIGTNAVEFN
jgi:DNA-binding beta-propeller fold protein YncE